MLNSKNKNFSVKCLRKILRKNIVCIMLYFLINGFYTIAVYLHLIFSLSLQQSHAAFVCLNIKELIIIILLLYYYYIIIILLLYYYL